MTTPSPGPEAPARARGAAESHPPTLPELTDIPRIIGRIDGPRSGPTLIVIGSLHGNEPAGYYALGRVVRALQADATGLQGSLVAITGNRGALARGQRFVTEDLNRIWLPVRRRHVSRAAGPFRDEEAELAELDRVLGDIVSEAGGEVCFLDVHSTSCGGCPFTSLDDTLPNRRLAFGIPVTHVLGLEEELTGTLVSTINAMGIAAIGFESGQNDDPRSVDRAEAAVWLALRAAGVLARGARDEVAAARRLLSQECAKLPDVVEVLHRHGVSLDDGFEMLPGFGNFQPITAGQELARSRDGKVKAPRDGLILMPLYQSQGDDGFFVVRPVASIWLTLSALLRKLRLERLVHWLPGVRKDSEQPGALLVDRRRARWLAREVFHLLGFRRDVQFGPYVRMVKRHDEQEGLPTWQ